MIFHRKKQSVVHRRQSAVPCRLRSAEPALSPRFARLLHESWWLLILVGFIYLALVLATYHRSDAGWSFSGSGAPLQNKGGAVGAWVAHTLLYFFGLSGWWG